LYVIIPTEIKRQYSLTIHYYINSYVTNLYCVPYETFLLVYMNFIYDISEHDKS